MKATLGMVVAVCMALVVSACSSPQSLILGKWEVESSPTKITAEFGKDGAAQLTMFGQTIRGAYKLNAENELEWTVNGMTTKAKVNVTATELEVTDGANRTIKYKRK